MKLNSEIILKFIMFNKPDFSKYSLDELYEAYESVDREEYPDRFQEIKEEIAKRQRGKYKCGKCGFEGYEIGEIRVSTSALQSLFEGEGGKFVSVSCVECGFTEFYKRKSSIAQMFLDFMV